jgi:hypothetical protein
VKNASKLLDNMVQKRLIARDEINMGFESIAENILLKTSINPKIKCSSVLI